MIQSPPCMLQTWETFSVLLQPPVWEAQPEKAEKWTVWESAMHRGASNFLISRKTQDCNALKHVWCVLNVQMMTFMTFTGGLQVCGLCLHVPKARGDRTSLSHQEVSLSLHIVTIMLSSGEHFLRPHKKKLLNLDTQERL